MKFFDGERRNYKISKPGIRYNRYDEGKKKKKTTSSDLLCFSKFRMFSSPTMHSTKYYRQLLRWPCVTILVKETINNEFSVFSGGRERGGGGTTMILFTVLSNK